MIAGSKRVAYTRFPSFLVMYEEQKPQRGKYCGERVTLFFKDPLDNEGIMDDSACSAEIFVWLGNMRHVNACWGMIPPGYEVDHEADLEALPSVLEFTKSSVSRCRKSIRFLILLPVYSSFNSELIYFKGDLTPEWMPPGYRTLWFVSYFTGTRWRRRYGYFFRDKISKTFRYEFIRKVSPRRFSRRCLLSGTRRSYSSPLLYTDSGNTSRVFHRKW